MAGQPVVLQAFFSPPHATKEQESLQLLCPVRVLMIYVHRSDQWRKSSKLLVCFGCHNRGNAKQCISHWITDTTSLSYEACRMASPLGVRTHSTRSIESSRALARGAPLQDVCAAAGWSSPHTFTRFYILDTDSAPGPQVLQN